jgi:uncharacterized protein
MVGCPIRDRRSWAYSYKLGTYRPESPMLQLRPNCECCNIDLPADSAEARICSFECTFCATCAADILHGVCPNCGGELLVRPRRPAEKLLANPPSSERVFKPQGCQSH